MKRLAFFLFILLSSSFFFSQDKKFGPCAANSIHRAKMKSSVQYAKKYQESKLKWESFYQEYSKSHYKNNLETITLTVVFHEISTDGQFLASSLEDYQSLVTQLNSEFSNIQIVDDSLSLNTGIQFCLAVQDSNETLYTIDQVQHHNPNVTSIDHENNNEINGVVNIAQNDNLYFDPHLYINIYIVDDIAGSVAGFATMPPDHGNTMDGIYVEKNVFNSSVNNFGVLVHEMGHYLDLKHIFGDCEVEGSCTNCEDEDPSECLNQGDNICDTVPFNLPPMGTNVCNDDSIFCSTNISATELLFIRENYMNYFNISCSSLFTPNQIAKMRFTLDEDFGFRSSLLANNACHDCSALQGCDIMISPVDSFDSNEGIIQIFTESEINAISLTANVSCPISTTAIDISWQLIHLNTGNPIMNIGNTYQFNVNQVGNYELRVRVSLSENINCYKEEIYTFQVIPDAGNCIAIIDQANSTPVYFSGGWAAQNGVLPQPQPNFGNNFQYVSFVNATDFQGYDINFPNLNLPQGLVNQNIIRVGQPILSGNENSLDAGAASYISFKFTPTSDNARFRVYFLGMTQNNSHFNTGPANLLSECDASTFGWFVGYEYNSPISSTNSGDNKIGTFIEPNNIVIYTYNDFIMGNLSNRYLNQYSINDEIFHTVVIDQLPYNVMSDWDYFDLDFSEFVDDPNSNIDDNLGTEITITFFARTDDDLNSQSHSYAYFGIECLGGGIPEFVNLDFENQAIDCDQDCFILGELERDNINNINFNLNKLTIEDSDSANFDNPSSQSEMDLEDLTIINSNYPTYSRGKKIELCIPEEDSDKFIRLSLNTLHQSVSDIFYVSKYGISNTIMCDDSNDTIGGTFEGYSLNNNDFYEVNSQQELIDYYFLCPETGLDSPGFIEINMSEPCFDDITNNGYTYQWYIDFPGYSPIPINSTYFSSNIISDEQNLILTINEINSFLNYHSNKYARIYREVYSNGVPCIYEILESEVFYIISLNPYVFNQDNSNNLESICAGRDFTITRNLKMRIADSYIVQPALEEYLDLNGISQEGQVTFEMQILDNENNIVYGPDFFGPYDIVNLPQSLNHNFQITSQSYNITQPGNYFVKVWADSNTHGCDDFRRVIFLDDEFLVVPASIGGEIELQLECDSINIVSTDHGLSNNDTYEWEISFDGINFQTLNIGEDISEASIDNLDFSIFDQSDYPIYIRRFSYPFNTENICEDNGSYSNTITINEPPQGYTSPVFNPISPICEGDELVLPTTSINGIVGTWSPEFNNQETTTYTFTPNEENCISSTSLTVEVNQLPYAGEAVEIEAICSSEMSYDLFSTIINYEAGGEWTDSSGMEIVNGIINPSDLVEGEYIYTYTVSNMEICSDSITVQIVIEYCNECTDGCNVDLAKDLATSTLESYPANSENCTYAVVLPDNIPDCYSLIVDWGDGNSSVEIDSNSPSTILEHEYIEEGSQFLCVETYYNGEICYSACDEIYVDCDTITCNEKCNTEVSMEIVNTIFNSLELGNNDCEFIISFPNLPNDCYSLTIDWGDGTTEEFHNNSDIAQIIHQYSANGNYEICVRLFYNGEECIKNCKRIEVKCIESCPDCKDVWVEWQESITPTENCGEYQIQAFQDFEKCYYVKLYLNGNTLYINPEGVFQLIESGENILTMMVIDVETGKICYQKDIIITVNCEEDCPDCKEAWYVLMESITPTENCGEYQIQTYAEMSQCYNIQIILNGFPIEISPEGIIQLGSEGEYELIMVLSDEENCNICYINTLPLIVECTEDCNCKLTLQQLVNSLSTTDSCGMYKLDMSLVNNECFKLLYLFNEENLVEINSDGTFQLNSNGGYNLLFVLYNQPNSRCASQMIHLDIDCFEDPYFTPYTNTHRSNEIFLEHATRIKSYNFLNLNYSNSTKQKKLNTHFNPQIDFSLFNRIKD